ncbi:unnamed protein product [Larinioides sclopetarius]|uniref:Uncharacterized protein n=1 Tax=Larinioides sclopetarius TaxID=280406 RepID=A0AAV2BTC5_9ARAC
MNRLVLITLCVIFTLVTSRAQVVPLVGRIPVFGAGGVDSNYAASLGGAPVGLYQRETDEGGRSEVMGASLGKAKVGLYGRERQDQLLPLLG